MGKTGGDGFWGHFFGCVAWATPPTDTLLCHCEIMYTLFVFAIGILNCNSPAYSR